MRNSPLREWLKEDRQWPRHLRIAHARLRLAEATELGFDDAGFWIAVLKANGAAPERR